MTITTTEPAAGTSRFRIGIATALLHAVPTDRADRSIDRYAGSACGTLSIIARNRGEFQRGNKHLDPHRMCPHCAWTVALANNTIEAEMAAIAPTAEEEPAWRRLLPDPDLLVRTCRAILDERRAEEEYDADHPSWAQLLGHITAHRPQLLFSEECAEGMGCEHDDDRASCYAATNTIACAPCSVRAGAWAGEWEGHFEVTVPAPCSVLLATAAAYPGKS